VGKTVLALANPYDQDGPDQIRRVEVCFTGDPSDAALPHLYRSVKETTALENSTVALLHAWFNRVRTSQIIVPPPSRASNRRQTPGRSCRSTYMQVSGKAFEKTVTLGGQEVTVGAVLNSNNAIRSVFPVQ
jgi:hypothetical protein